MIVAIYGKDQFSKRIQIEKFLDDALGDRKNDPLSKQVIFAGDSEAPSVAGAIMEACGSVSMFAPDQAVVVHNADQMKADETKSLARFLKDGPECKLLLEFDELRSNSEMFKVLSKVGQVNKYDEPKQRDMSQWISSMVSSYFKKNIDYDACQYLAEALGTNTKVVADEVEKVLLYKPDCTKITLDLVKMMVVQPRYIPPFEILNFFGMRDPVGYTRKLHEIFNGKDDEIIKLVNALYNHAVDLLNFMSLTMSGMSSDAAAKEIGKEGPAAYAFVKNGNAPECCRRWGKAALSRVIRRLAELNYEFKSSSWKKPEQELALAALVVR